MTTADRAQRYDAAVEALLLLADDVSAVWKATVADDPGFVMGQIGRAYLACLSSEGPDATKARTTLEQIDPRGLSDVERRHLDAARAYATGDLYGAADRLAALSVEYPDDALALAVGHQLDFFCGDAVSLRDRIGRAVSSWDPSHPHYGFVLGMHAFGLEECGLYPQAEEAGLAALERQPRDVWALHAVVHTHEMRGQVAEGLRLMDERRADWTVGNFFVVHNRWHEALFRLDAGDRDAALAIYDASLHNAESENVALEMLDATALLWRMHLAGEDVGGRWEPLAAAWADIIGEPWYAFNDAHATMAFVGAGRMDDARAVVDRLAAYLAAARDDRVSNVSMTSAVGLPVSAAVVAFGEGRYEDVVSTLFPIRTIVHRFGGSHAQRDAVARTLLEAAIRGGNKSLARALVSERLAVRGANPFNQRLRARVA